MDPELLLLGLILKVDPGRVGSHILLSNVTNELSVDVDTDLILGAAELRIPGHSKAEWHTENINSVEVFFSVHQNVIDAINETMTDTLGEVQSVVDHIKDLWLDLIEEGLPDLLFACDLNATKAQV